MGFRARLARRWSAFTATGRRRIVLGAFLALSLAARDLVLLLVAASMLALSELAPTPRASLRAAS